MVHTISESIAADYINSRCVKEKPDLLLVSGPTGSGKSTLCEKITKQFNLTILSLDNYFKNEEEIEMILPQFNIRQWDSPNCYNWNILLANLQAIFRQEITKIPIFSHKLSKQNGWKDLFLETKPLILEGLYAMHPEILKIVNLMKLKTLSIFLYIPEEIRWQRKYNRDVKERNEEPATLRIWFDSIIKPAEKKWINKQLINADLIITND